MSYRRAVCDVVIPCRDEAPALPALLAKLPLAFRAVVVDNGSRDGTAEVARGLGASVVDEPRPGYGAAVHAGLVAATADYVAVMDGDGSMDPADLVRLLEHVTEGGADLAVGRRRPTRSGVWPWHARLGNALVLWWLRHRLDLPLRDIAPMRVARRQLMLGLGIEDRRFGYPVDTVEACSAAYGAARCHLAIDGVLAHGRIASELLEATAGWKFHPQRGAGFAERLVNAHEDAAAASGAPVVQVGMDTPRAFVLAAR